MKEVYIISESIISALGNGIDVNMRKIEKLESGIKASLIEGVDSGKLPIGAIDWDALQNEFKKHKLGDNYSRFEKLMILSVIQALENTNVKANDEKVVFVISTTKGNIELLDNSIAKKYKKSKLELWDSANKIAKYFGNKNDVITISNACVSGVMAVADATDILRTEDYEHAIVVGGDIISKFVVSGFRSFQSLSSKACKPYDKSRDGLNIGEAASCIILSTKFKNNIQVLESASHNDANHISGPSRTAEGMFYAVSDALKHSHIKANQIDSISAHGTATAYNDEMEAIGFSRLELESTHVHSLKGFWGHTLGAAGIIETAALVWSMRQNKTLPTLGFEEMGVSIPLNINTEIRNKNIKYSLKIASGFSGINSAIVLKKGGGEK
jgi:3-oxoacyl-[acyl-carrier-protein] synthase-1